MEKRFNYQQTYLKDQIKRRISKADLFLIGLLLLVGAGSLLAVHFMEKQKGAFVCVTVDGAVYGNYELSKVQDIPIKVHGIVTNTLQIAQEEAKMIQADCPDRLCVHQRAIAGQGETIVCLPNKIVVEVKGEHDAEFDSIAR